MSYQSNIGEPANQEIHADPQQYWPPFEPYSSAHGEEWNDYRQTGQPMYGTGDPNMSSMYQQPMYGGQAQPGMMYDPYGPQQPQMMGGQMPGQMMQPQQQQQMTPQGMLPLEQSFVENILRFNRGKRARFYMTFENNPEWPARVFTGVIEEAGRDHIIVSSPQEGQNYLLLMVNLDFVEFEDEIDYVSPQALGPAAGSPQR